MDALQKKASPISIVATAILVLLLALSILKLVREKKRNYPPVAATIFHQLLNFHRLHDFQTDLSRKYKTFRILTPFCNYVYIVDPVNVEYILKTNFTNYPKGEANYDVLKGLFGDGIFAVDGEKWKQQRKIASYEFSMKVLRDYSSEVFKSNATRLASKILDAVNSRQMMDIQDLLMKSTLDSIFKVGFGLELEALSGSSKEGTAFARAFDDSGSQMMHRYIDVFWKVKRLLNIGSEAMLKENIKVIDSFLYKLIDTKVEQLATQQAEFMKKQDILSRFLVERERDPSTMTYRYLRDIVLNFVIAGRDTTAGTLSWFFYMLCKHPDVQEKVAQEVMKLAADVKDQVSIGEFSAFLTEEVLNRMQYLHAALTETLRLYPAVPLDVKLCSSDDTLPDGFKVRKGDFVNYQPYCMGRMNFLWGNDAENFRPERWLNSDGIFQPESPFKFPVFQAGPRTCLGKDFAYRQMKIFAAVLLFFFKFKLWDEKEHVRYRTTITLQIDGGLHLYALHRDSTLN